MATNPKDAAVGNDSLDSLDERLAMMMNGQLGPVPSFMAEMARDRETRFMQQTQHRQINNR